MKTHNDPRPTRDTGPELRQRATTIASSQELLDAPESVATATAGQSPLLEIANAMVALYKETFGRGPTKARARFAGHDTLLVTLESCLTVAERNLRAMGEHQRIREARLLLAEELQDRLRAIVENALGRKTLAYMTGLDTVRDVAIELFTLGPAGPASNGAWEPDLH